MARKTARPGRTLVVFFLAVAIAYGLVAIGGTWKPALGLDLKGGTRITMIAQGNPTKENLDEAAGIIDQRVNGSGVTEAEVNTQGSNIIVVEVPGDTSNSLVNTVTRVAQLRFLDLDHPRAEVGQEPRDQGSRQIARDVDHRHAAQRLSGGRRRGAGVDGVHGAILLRVLLHRDSCMP